MDNLTKSIQNIYPEINFSNSSVLQVTQGNDLITEKSIIGQQFKSSFLPYISPLKYNNPQISSCHMVLDTNNQVNSINLVQLQEIEDLKKKFSSISIEGEEDSKYYASTKNLTPSL